MERLKKRFLAGAGAGVVFAVLFLAVGLQGIAASSQSSTGETPSVGLMTFIPSTNLQNDINTQTAARTANPKDAAGDVVTTDNWSYTCFTFFHGFPMSPHVPPHVTILPIIIDLILLEIFIFELIEFVFLI
jgi:hypothetical protein